MGAGLKKAPGLVAMALEIHLAAALRSVVPDYNPRAGLSMEVEPGTSIMEIMRILGIDQRQVKMVMVNGKAALKETILSGEERVGLFPPVGGG